MKKRIVVMSELSRFVAVVALCLVLPLAASASDDVAGRRRISLDGTWNFSTDPDRQGEAAQWYLPSVALPTEVPAGYAPKVAGKIQVPGSWDAQGYGVETERVRHNFVGQGWYRRELPIPSDWSSSNSTFLVLSGISRYAKVWIDGVAVGPEAIGCIGSHEWDITPYVKAGRTSSLTVCVDSRQRWDIDPLLGTAQLNDYLEVAWGGLWGHVYVESRPRTRLESIYLRTSLGYSSDGVIRESSCGVRATILDERKRANISGTLMLELFSADGTLAARSSKGVTLHLSQGCADVELWAEVPDARLWTPDTPYLYNARVTFTTSDGIADVREHRYGMREILFAGNGILLNGRPLYLRGYGDDHIYPEQFSLPTDTELYRQRLRTIKAYGFNHCRHHSIVMPHEYYDACDEVGMLPSPEMLIAYSPQLPGTGSLWLGNVSAGTSPEPANNTIVERFRAVVREYRNHPSILVWVGGNEMGLFRSEWDRATLRTRCFEAAREEDPDRPFTDCDGDWLKDYVAQGGRDTQDCYSILFDEWCNPFANPDKFQTSKPFDKPTVAHETGNFLAFPRTDQFALFDRSNIKPFWMEEGIERLRQRGLDGEADDWARASEYFYLQLHKCNVEAIRRSPQLSGYHWWLINDYWTTSNGLFDHFFRPKSIRPQDVLPFNSETVLLVKNLGYSYRAGESITLTPYVSNYGPEALSGEVTYTLTVDGESVAERKARCIGAPSGKLTTLSSVRLSCPRVTRPCCATLRMTLATADSTYSNSWDTYVFPTQIAPETEWPIYADDAARRLFPSGWNVHPLSELGGEYPARAVYAVGYASKAICEAVRRGAGLIHLDASQLFTALPVTYKTTWWKAGDAEDSNILGTYVYENAIVDEVTDHHICPPAWMTLLDGAVKYALDGRDEQPEVVVRALSSIVRLRDTAILFAFGYGQGKVLADGLNHSADVASPLSRWLLARMVDFLASDRKAKVQWDDLPMTVDVSLPEGTTQGVESVLSYSERVTWNTFYNQTQSALQWICRQDAVGNEVAWNTAVPATGDKGGTTTFIFAGSTGYATQPRTAGFVLSLNDEDILRFDVVETFDGTTDIFSWENKAKGIQLRFRALAETVPDDKYGIFRLTVPNAYIKKGVSQKLAVRSLSSGSRRWFSIQDYPNLTAGGYSLFSQ